MGADSFSSVRNVALADIHADQRAQPRESLNTEITESYANDMTAGAKFPPLVVFFDGRRYWLADGFHRRYAAMSAGLGELPCEVRSGGLREAILHSCSANSAHGYRRSNEDKRRAVLKLLGDEEWCKWSDHEVARRAGVSHPFVGSLRSSLVTVTSDPRTYTTKHGTVAKMRVPSTGRPSASKHTAPSTVTNKAATHVPSSSPQRGKAAVCARVREAITQLSGLPPAREVARYLAACDDGVLVAERLPAVRAWINELNDAMEVADADHD